MRDRYYIAEDVCLRLLRSELWSAPLEIPAEFDYFGTTKEITYRLKHKKKIIWYST